MSRCTPRSPCEQAVRVAALHGERRRADARPRCPAAPRRSRRRSRAAPPSAVNMRSSISVQSCASVPPAPECTSQIASRSSCSPVNSARSSSRSSSPRERRRCPSSISGSTESSLSSRAELVERLEVGEPLARARRRARRRRGTARELGRRPCARASGSSQRSGLLASSSSSPMPRARVVDAQVRVRVARRGGADRRGRRRSRASSRRSAGRAQRPWQSLYFLPLPQ